MANNNCCKKKCIGPVLKKEMEINVVEIDLDNQTKTVYYKDSNINKVTHTFNLNGNLNRILYEICLDYLKRHEYID